MRRNFSSSKLVRLLHDLAQVDVVASGPDVAEGLGLWLNAFDAIGLHSTLQSLKMVAVETLAGAPAPPTGIAEEVQRVRSALVALVKTASEERPASALDTSVTFAPYRQRYLDQQRQMALRIGPLRERVRQVLSAASPPLKQLATIDAALDEMLAGREQQLLASVPALLKRRFEHLRHAHQQLRDATQPPDDRAMWRQPSHWPDQFGQELQAVLLAELEVRLEPVTGLTEAFNKEMKISPFISA